MQRILGANHIKIKLKETDKQMFIGQIKSKKESQYKSRENQQIEGKTYKQFDKNGWTDKKKTMQEQYPGSQVCKDDERTL